MKISSALIVLSLTLSPLMPRANAQGTAAPDEHAAWAKDHADWEQQHKRAKDAVRSLEKLIRGHNKAMKMHEREVRKHDAKKHDQMKATHELSVSEHAQLMKIVEEIETLAKDHDKHGDHE